MKILPNNYIEVEVEIEVQPDKYYPRRKYFTPMRVYAPDIRFAMGSQLLIHQNLPVTDIPTCPTKNYKANRRDVNQIRRYLLHTKPNTFYP